MLEALRFVAIPAFNPWAIYSPVGDVIAKALSGSISVSQASAAYAGLWWVDMFSVMALIAAVPFTKLAHVFTSGTNVAVAPQKPMGRLDTPFSLAAMLQNPDAQIPPNVTAVGGFAPLQLLALDACTNCGRCQEVCPAYAAGRDLSPRIVIQDLGAGMKRDRSGDVFANGTIREQELWSCTTCNACVNVCPVLIDQVDYIVEFRRTLVAREQAGPAEEDIS